MSFLLLQDPEKLHDMLDDLESVFWVTAFCALDRFLRPNRIGPMTMFDEERVDDEGRTVGGLEKSVTMLTGTLCLKKFTCPTLQELIYECSQFWAECHLASRDDPRFFKHVSEGIRDRMRKTLDSASQPVFWSDLYASALKKTSSCCANRSSPTSSHGGQRHKLFPAADDPPRRKKRAVVCSDVQSQPLRQSKRMRVQ